jgi:predicted RNase H-like HicB family nuclease
VLLEDKTDGYVAILPALPGCHRQGDTLVQVIENAKRSHDLYLETPTAGEKKELLVSQIWKLSTGRRLQGNSIPYVVYGVVTFFNVAFLLQKFAN